MDPIARKPKPGEVNGTAQKQESIEPASKPNLMRTEQPDIPLTDEKDTKARGLMPAGEKEKHRPKTDGRRIYGRRRFEAVLGHLLGSTKGSPHMILIDVPEDQRGEFTKLAGGRIRQNDIITNELPEDLIGVVPLKSDKFGASILLSRLADLMETRVKGVVVPLKEGDLGERLQEAVRDDLGTGLEDKTEVSKFFEDLVKNNGLVGDIMKTLDDNHGHVLYYDDKNQLKSYDIQLKPSPTVEAYEKIYQNTDDRGKFISDFRSAIKNKDPTLPDMVEAVLRNTREYNEYGEFVKSLNIQDIEDVWDPRVLFSEAEAIAMTRIVRSNVELQRDREDLVKESRKLFRSLTDRKSKYIALEQVLKSIEQYRMLNPTTNELGCEWEDLTKATEVARLVTDNPIKPETPLDVLTAAKAIKDELDASGSLKRDPIRAPGSQSKTYVFDHTTRQKFPYLIAGAGGTQNDAEDLRDMGDVIDYIDGSLRIIARPGDKALHGDDHKTLGDIRMHRIKALHGIPYHTPDNEFGLSETGLRNIESLDKFIGLDVDIQKLKIALTHSSHKTGEFLGALNTLKLANPERLRRILSNDLVPMEREIESTVGFYKEIRDVIVEHLGEKDSGGSKGKYITKAGDDRNPVVYLPPELRERIGIAVFNEYAINELQELEGEDRRERIKKLVDKVLASP